MTPEEARDIVKRTAERLTTYYWVAVFLLDPWDPDWRWTHFRRTLIEAGVPRLRGRTTLAQLVHAGGVLGIDLVLLLLPDARLDAWTKTSPREAAGLAVRLDLLARKSRNRAVRAAAARLATRIRLSLLGL